MTYLFVTLPFLVLAWICYTSRNWFLSVSRWILARRYSVSVTGVEAIDRSKIQFVVPNHPAIVDPYVLVTELHAIGVDVRPLVDESFFSNRMMRHLLALFEAVRVPDFRKINFRPILKIHPARRDAARRAKALAYTVLATLTGGGNVLLYPSGHISADGREELSNRQLAHNVVSQLPSDVEVLGVRIRGLFGSMWSRAGGKAAPPFIKTLVKAAFMWFGTAFRKKREVTIHFENLTAKAVEWAKEGRAYFNAKIEDWYDSDLRAKGLVYEPAL